MCEVRLTVEGNFPTSCSDCDMEATNPITRFCGITGDTTTHNTNSRKANCPLKNDGYFLSDLQKEDLDLIKSAMTEAAVSRRSDTLGDTTGIPQEVIDRCGNEAARLVFLVNVITGKFVYKEREK